MQEMRDRAHLDIEVLQDLDERRLQPWYLEPVAYPPYQADRIDFRANILQEPLDEGRPRLAILQQILPKIVIVLLFRKVDSLDTEGTALQLCQDSRRRECF